VRVPLIPGFNADRQSLVAIAEFVRSLETVREVHVLAYHTLGRSKYRALGLPYELEQYPPMILEEANHWSTVFSDYGFEVIVGG
jgi:pyruvate-formate lyase-activating enzyme